MIRYSLVFLLVLLFVCASVSMGFVVSGNVLGVSGFSLTVFVIAVPMSLDTTYFTIANPIQSYSYNLSGMHDGSYVLFSFKDQNGNLTPDLDEPRGFYGGQVPQLLVLSSDTANIDIILSSGNSGGFTGALSYAGASRGPTFVMVHRTADFSDAPHGFGVLLDGTNLIDNGNGDYTALADSFGTYYAYAFMDLNSNFMHDATEPYGVYGGDTPAAIDIQPSNFPDNVDIVMEDPNEASPEVEVPEVAGLGEIYPNPFNSTAVIPFTVTQPTRVELRLFDLLGREVAVLAKGVYPTGEHEVEVKAGELPSGLYVVELSAGDVANYRRLLLLK